MTGTNASGGSAERLHLIEDCMRSSLSTCRFAAMHLGDQAETPMYGRSLSYCTGGVSVLSEVLEKATGQRTDRYAQQMLIGPLGISEAKWVYSPAVDSSNLREGVLGHP